MADFQGVTVEGLRNQGHVCYFNSTLQASDQIIASLMPLRINNSLMYIFVGIGVVQCVDARFAENGSCALN